MWNMLVSSENDCVDVKTVFQLELNFSRADSRDLSLLRLPAVSAALQTWSPTLLNPSAYYDKPFGSLHFFLNFLNPV